MKKGLTNFPHHSYLHSLVCKPNRCLPPLKLVVGLTIDQLRTDYLEAFSSLIRRERASSVLLRKREECSINAEYTFLRNGPRLGHCRHL